MLKLPLIALAILSGNAENLRNIGPQKIVNTNIEGHTWQFKAQYFASHDHAGTDVDTISGNGNDYLYFDKNNNKAYSHFNGISDTTAYRLIGKDSISFGDTPFRIVNTEPDQIELYQNEEEPNGDYNRVYYILKSSTN